jgi:hypothetical protein
MKPGQRYLVIYKIPGLHRVDREMVADYVDDKTEGDRTMLLFSGRPEFGNTYLNLADVSYYTRSNQHSKCYTDRKVSRPWPT